MISKKRIGNWAVTTTAVSLLAGLFFISSKSEQNNNSLERKEKRLRESSSSRDNENGNSIQKASLRGTNQNDDFSWVSLESINEPIKEEFPRTWTIKEYDSFRKKQPDAPDNWWIGIVGAAWKDQATHIPKNQSIKIIQEIEKVSSGTPISGNPFFIENDGIYNDIRMYRSFDKIMDSNILSCKQAEICWAKEDNYFLLFERPENWSSIKDGVAIRKDDGAVFKWELVLRKP